MIHEVLRTLPELRAAAEALTMIAVRTMTQPGLTEFTAEGATFKRSQPDWWGAATAIRRHSPLLQALTGDGLGVISLDRGTGYDTTAQTWPDHPGPRIIGNWT